MTLDIQPVTTLSEPLLEALARLMPQLSPRFGAPSEQQLQRLIEGDTSVLFAAWHDGQVVGVLTLGWYDTPSGRKAWIEDVVVDVAARGLGAGRVLVAEALAEAKKRGAEQVSLTSAAEREAARGLYQKMGFKELPTSVFALKI